MRTIGRRHFRWTGWPLALGLALGCTDAGDRIVEPGPATERVIVLNSLGQAYQLMDLDEDGLLARSVRVQLPETFDGVVFDIRGTLALTTGSELKGSWVFITDLAGGTTFSRKMPDDFDDPAAVRYKSPDTAFVAARGSGLVHRLTLTDSAIVPLFTDTIAQSPYDVIPFGNRLYVVDANQHRTDFSTLGPSRVVVLDLASGLPVDTVELTGFGAIAGALKGSKLFVLESGLFTDPQGKLAVIDLAGVDPVVELDLEGFGLSLEPGNDGRLYVSVVPNLAAFDTKVIVVVDPTTNGFVHGPDAPLPLKRPDGSAASCYAATASAGGKVFCIEDRGVERGLLYVYGPDLVGRTAITLDALPTDLLVLDLP